MLLYGDVSIDAVDEGEFTATLRLLKRVVVWISMFFCKKNLPLYGIIILKFFVMFFQNIFDALACNSVFIKECLKLGIDVIVRVKKTTNLSLKEVKRVTNKTDRVLEFKENRYEIEVYESTFYMNDMDQPIRYIKYTKERKFGTETK